MSIFKFKQFQIQQKLAAAKVGTDGVLLGSWVQLPTNPTHILDVGSGTGLIALMMAQRFANSEIIGLEIDENAAQEAKFNFENSAWHHRLHLENMAFQNYETPLRFDLIISNPPFYKEDTSSSHQPRDVARNMKHLPLDVLIQKSESLLKKEGVLAVIIPYSAEKEFIDLAKENQLYPIEIRNIQGRANTPIKRSLISFSKTKAKPIIKHLIIEKERHLYTQDYINLTHSFYLHM